MKTVIVYISLLVLFVHFHTTSGPTPLYENSYRTLLPSRVITDINKNVANSCQVDELEYRVADEKIIDTDKSFVYQIKFASSAISTGKIVVEENHSGDVVLQKLECPGKSGEWYSYSNPTKSSRQIAGL